MAASGVPPSAQWTSFAGWDYNGMKERLEGLLARIDKTRHAETLLGQKVTMSEPFSAGQYWICLEMVAEDGSLVIARVRLPRHPDTPPTVSEEDEQYSIAYEIATMTFVRQNVPAITLPRIYAYRAMGPSWLPKLVPLICSWKASTGTPYRMSNLACAAYRLECFYLLDISLPTDLDSDCNSRAHYGQESRQNGPL